MAYSDLYADASLYMDLNNNYNYVNTGTLNTTAYGTGTPVFVNDAPANTGSTHSFKMNGYSSSSSLRPPKYIFSNFPEQNLGRTITFWFKFKKAAGGSFVFGENMGIATNVLRLDPNSTSSNEDTITLNFGVYTKNHIATDRKITGIIRTVNTSSNQSTALFPSNVRKLEQDTWYHIALVQNYVSAAKVIETALYINGGCASYNTTPNMNGFLFPLGFGQGSGVYGAEIFDTESQTTTDKYIAHYALYKRALNRDEIRAQAWYGLSGGNYVDLVNSDSPLYFTTLENQDKATDPTVYGATSWGPINDNRAGVSVNELGYPTGKSWRIFDSGTSGENFADTNNVNFTRGMNTVIRSGEYSYEFWFKMSGKPSTAKKIVESGGGTPGAGQQTWSITNNGRIEFRTSYRTGTSSYVSGSIANTSPGLPPVGTVIYPGDTSPGLNGWADGQWHHVVYTQSNSNYDGSYHGLVYIDGAAIDSRNWPNTNGWLNLDSIDASSWFSLGANQSTFNNFFFDNVAIYARELTSLEVQEHFIAGKTYVEPSARVVKHWTGGAWVDSVDQKVWDGNAWVNWDAKYWNGTAWIDL
jgi:hypothetical protein